MIYNLLKELLLMYKLFRRYLQLFSNVKVGDYIKFTKPVL